MVISRIAARLRNKSDSRNPASVLGTSEDRKRAKGSPYRRAGDAARNQAQWSEAAAQYRKHLERFPEDFAIWVQLGHAEKEAGSLDRAGIAYRTALQLEPDDADLLINLGHLYKKQGELAQAAQCYFRSYAIDRNTAAGSELQNRMLAPFLVEVERSARRPEAGRVAICRGRLDGSSGWRIEGWAVDSSDDSPEILFFQEGRLVGAARPTKFRADLLEEDLGTCIAGFETELDLDFSSSPKVRISARFARNGQALENSPLEISAPDSLSSWLRRREDVRGAELKLLVGMADRVDGLLSIIMPVYNTRAEWLREALDSVLAQWCGKWELICVDDASTADHVRDILTEYAAREPRIRPLHLSDNVGIAGATNRGIAAARGSYVAFLDHDDALEPDAVWRMLEAAAHGPSLIYSDEAITAASIDVVRHIVARPAFSYDYYLSHPYFVHFVAVRREIAMEIGGLDEKLRISADVDFVIRVIEKSETVAHVPAVLYRWRTHDASTGHALMDQVTNATLGAINRHFARTGQSAKASPGLAFNGYRIDYPDDPAPTLVIIPTKNKAGLVRKAVSSILETTSRDNVDILVIDHESDEVALKDYLASVSTVVRTLPYSGPFNFARMNNFAVAEAAAKYKYILFCNNDIEAIDRGWIEHMRGLCARADVGAVGATLLYPDNTIQHSGVVMGLRPLADHAHKFRPFLRTGEERNVGYNYALASTREYSAVTAACMMMRTELFQAISGFDEELAVGFNDTDLCLRAGAEGYKVLLDPYAVLYHHESATRAHTAQVDHPEDAAVLRRRWLAILQGGDPFYSPLLSLDPSHDHGQARPDAPYRGARLRPAAVPIVTDYH